MSHTLPVPAHGTAAFVRVACFEAVRSMLTLLVISLFVVTFIVQPFRIPSESMKPTLLVGDFLLVNKMVYGRGSQGSASLLPYEPIRRGDVIVFRYPMDPTLHLVKRVIGLPGDRIKIENGLVYLNGQAQREPYIAETAANGEASIRSEFPATLYTDPGVDPHWWLQMRTDTRNGELVVPPESYFVLGDNRNDSRDSRYWGFVPRRSIVGQPVLIYFSLRGGPHTSAGAEADQDAAAPRRGADDRLGHDTASTSALSNFARWHRMFRVVR